MIHVDVLHSMEHRCDQVIHCRDNSDEKNCYLLVFKEKESYNKKVPPFTISAEDKLVSPVLVKVSTSLMNVLAISEFSHTIDLKLGITLKWYENRVLYHNLKVKEALNTLSDLEAASIWIPYIIFKNTDNDEAITTDIKTSISITRGGQFTRSGAQVADEVK